MEATEECLVKIRKVIIITIYTALNPRVDSSYIIILDIPIKVLDRFAGVDVDKLTVQDKKYFWFFIKDIMADQLILDPEGVNLIFKS